MNLLQETLQTLARNNKTPEDVDWVGCRNMWSCTWGEFASIAAEIEYDSGYGIAEIEEGLLVVGHDDWWLERHEYDGSEWWEYKTLPLRPDPIDHPLVVKDISTVHLFEECGEFWHGTNCECED